MRIYWIRHAHETDGLFIYSDGSVSWTTDLLAVSVNRHDAARILHTARHTPGYSIERN